MADVALFLLHWLPSLLLVPFLTFFFLRDGTAFHRLVLRAVPNAFFEKTLPLRSHKLTDGVTGNTSDFGSEESRFEP